MTSVQYEVAQPFPPPCEDKSPEKDTAITHSDWVAFLCVLRQCLLQIVRWIERQYPEAVR